MRSPSETDPALRAQPPVAHQLEYLRHIAEQALTAGRLPITDGGMADQQKYLSEVKDPRLIIALLDRLAAAEAAPLDVDEVVAAALALRDEWDRLNTAIDAWAASSPHGDPPDIIEQRNVEKAEWRLREALAAPPSGLDDLAMEYRRGYVNGRADGRADGVLAIRKAWAEYDRDDEPHHFRDAAIAALRSPDTETAGEAG